MSATPDLRLAKEIREMADLWPCRALAGAKGKTGMVLLSVLAHNYDEAVQTFCRIVFPGFIEPALPCLVSAAKVAKSGAVVADVLDREGRKHIQVPIYTSELALRDDFRNLADELKFSDADRTDMFKAVQRWVVADTRLDPTMDPQDPDAKRLRLH